MNDKTQQPLTTWWTTEGFSQAPEPELYTALPRTGDWEEMLKTAGYEPYTSCGGEYDNVQLEVHSHRNDDHLLVCINNANGGLAGFFVSDENRAAFFATWYVQFLRDAAVIAQTEALEQIAKTLTAFVRRGHSTDTIDEYGETDKDDRIERHRQYV
jgi:hypothetical protein